MDTPVLSPPPSSATDLAALDTSGKHWRVQLPQTWLEATLRLFFSWHRLTPQLSPQPQPGDWRVRWDGPRLPGLHGQKSEPTGTHQNHLEIRDASLKLTPAAAKRLLRALEAVKPEAVDADGCPLPWIQGSPAPPPPPLDALMLTSPDDMSAIDPTGVTTSAPHPPPPWISQALQALCTHSGLHLPQLELRPANAPQDGFVGGRIYYDTAYQPRRLVLIPCPNADRAEVFATLCHELAHPLAQTHHHDQAFKEALLQLASSFYGPRYFQAASQHLPSPYAVLDGWVALSIRASLQKAAPPETRNADDSQTATALRRIGKLRGLARDQQGRPEGIAASVTARELSTLYGLEDVASAASLSLAHEADLFLYLGGRSRWRQVLLHAIAAYYGVFSLVIPRRNLAHLFGHEADLIRTRYLYEISSARIEREAARYLEIWKARQKTRHSGATRSEKTSFCDSAALAFKAKLERLEGDGTEHERRERAEALAEYEHARRGQGWRSGRSREYRPHAAGHRVGEAMSVHEGVASGGAPQLGWHKGSR